MSELVALFGGTFDPVHKGHLGALNLLCQKIDFDRVHWVLSARPPHKDQTTASIEHRFAMLQLALADNPAFVADDTEIKRQARSYTIDTVEAFKAAHPKLKLSVIIGADSLHSLPRWRRYADLVEQVNWIVMRRPGYELDFPHALSERRVDSVEALLASDGGSIWCFEQSAFDVSSTKLRAELGQGDDKLAKEYLPRDVLSYIRAHQLYKIDGASPIVD